MREVLVIIASDDDDAPIRPKGLGAAVDYEVKHLGPGWEVVSAQSSCSISTRSDRRGFYTAIVTTIVVEKEDDKSAEPQQS